MRVGFLGCGAIALEHARAAQALGHEVAAAAARSPESPRWKKFQAAFPRARFVAPPDALLADPDVDAVVACASWDAMPDWLERLLACPKPVLLEKPVALDAGALVGALARFPGAARNKRVGYNRRFYEPVFELRERLEAGGLRSAEVTVSEDLARHVERQGRGVLAHLPAFSSHVFDLALWLLGPLKPVRSYPLPERGDKAPFVSLHALFETPSGAPVWLAANADDPTPVGLRCRFEDGSAWHLAPLELLRVYQGVAVEPPAPGASVRRYAPVLRKEVAADAALKPGLRAQLEAFLSGRYGPAATLEESVELLRFLESLYGIPARAG